MLKRKVPVNKVGSYGMTVTFERSRCRSTLAMSTPSMKIAPDSNSIILESVSPSVDFPAPVLPTTPTFIPGSAVKVKFLITRSVLGLYRREI